MGHCESRIELLWWWWLEKVDGKSLRVRLASTRRKRGEQFIHVVVCRAIAEGETRRKENGRRTVARLRLSGG